MLISIVLYGCSPSSEEVYAPSDTSYKSGVSDYILTSALGSMKLYDVEGKELSAIELKKENKKDNFIYTKDVLGNTFYAINKRGNNLYKVEANERALQMQNVKQINEKEEITYFEVEGDKLYYSYKSNKNAFGAEKYTVVKEKKQQMNGELGVQEKVIPLDNQRQHSTYIRYVNLSKNETRLYEIPAELDKWTVRKDKVYFFYSVYCGEYDIKKREIGIYEMGGSAVDIFFYSGINEKLFVLSDFGSGMHKSMLVQLSTKDSLFVENIYVLDKPNPLALGVDKTKSLFIVYRRLNEGENFHSNVVTLDYKTKKIVSDMPLSYVPTKIRVHNDRIYLFNPHESTFYIASYGSKQGASVDKGEASDILLVNLYPEPKEELEVKKSVEDLYPKTEKPQATNEEKPSIKGYYDENGKFIEPKAQN